jgi:hypothetical protein
VFSSREKMGCCKSQEIQKDTKDTLLQKDQQTSSSSSETNGNRGLSLQKNFSPFAGFLGIGPTTVNREESEEIQPYQPPIIPNKQRKFQGKSILKPPHLDDLRRSGWIDKRGHLVSLQPCFSQMIMTIGEELEESIYRLGS